MSSYTLSTDTLTVAKNQTSNLWEQIDISNISLRDLFANYRPIEVPLLDIFSNEKTLLLHSYETELKYSTLTLSKWLVSIANLALITTDGFPTYKEVTVPYVPLAYHKGTLTLAKEGYHPTQKVPYDDLNDLVVDFAELDNKTMQDACLFSVNGFFLTTKYHTYGVRINRAGDMIRKSKEGIGGFLLFNNVGSIKQVPITKDMVYKVDDTKSYFERLIINTKESLRNKTVGIVIGGYLHLLDDVVNVMGDNSITVSLRNFNLVERIKQSRGYLDLPFEGIDDISGGIPTSNLYSDQAVLDYMTMDYSFIVIIDNAEVYTERGAVSSAAMAGTYIIPDSINLGFLTDQIGRGIDYWPKWECGQWALKTTADMLETMLEETTSWKALTKLTDAAVPYKPEIPVRPVMWQIKARTE